MFSTIARTTGTTFIDATVDVGTTYRYRIAAVEPAGTARSNIVTVSIVGTGGVSEQLPDDAEQTAGVEVSTMPFTLDHMVPLIQRLLTDLSEW